MVLRWKQSVQWANPSIATRSTSIKFRTTMYIWLSRWAPWAVKPAGVTRLMAAIADPGTCATKGLHQWQSSRFSAVVANLVAVGVAS